MKSSLVSVADAITNQASAIKAYKELGNKFKQFSPWSIAKSTGSASIPNGQASVSYGQLISKLKKIGVYVVEVGELESFVRSVGNHGPRWVNGVLEKDISNGSEFDVAKSFVMQVLDIPAKEYVSSELANNENEGLTYVEKIKRGLIKDFARLPRKLAAVFLAIGYILSYAQGKIIPLQVSQSLSSEASREDSFYFLTTSLLICYIIASDRKLSMFAVSWIVIMFIGAFILALYHLEYLLKQPIILTSYVLFFLFQGYGIWLLYKNGIYR